MRPGPAQRARVAGPDSCPPARSPPAALVGLIVATIAEFNKVDPLAAKLLLPCEPAPRTLCLPGRRSGVGVGCFCQLSKVQPAAPAEW